MFSLFKPTNRISMKQIEQGINEVSSKKKFLINQNISKYNELREKLNQSCSVSLNGLKQKIQICQQFMMITQLFIKQVDQPLKINLKSQWRSPLTQESAIVKNLSQEKMLIGINVVLSIINLALHDHDSGHPFLLGKLEKVKIILSMIMIEKEQSMELPFSELKTPTLILLQQLAEAIIDKIDSEKQDVDHSTTENNKAIKVFSAYRSFENCMKIIQEHEGDLSQFPKSVKSYIQSQFQLCRAKFHFYQGKQFESEGKAAEIKCFYRKCLYGCQQLENRFSGQVRSMRNQCRQFFKENQKEEKQPFESTASQLIAPLVQSKREIFQEEPQKLRRSITSIILDDDDEAMPQSSINISGSELKIGQCKKGTFSTTSLLSEDVQEKAKESGRLMKKKSNPNGSKLDGTIEGQYCQCFSFKWKLF